MIHKDLDEVIGEANERGQQSLVEAKTAKKMHTIPWISVVQALPKNDSLVPRAQRRQYLVKLLPDGNMAIAVFGYAGHDWWVDSLGRLLTPDYGYRVTGWCPLPSGMGDDTLPESLPSTPNKPAPNAVCSIR